MLFKALSREPTVDYAQLYILLDVGVCGNLRSDRGQETFMHALIIEDEAMIAMAIEDILRDNGFTSFDLAATPQSAIDAAAHRCPDLITSDVQLKPGCGIETVLTICGSVTIPFIFITGNLPDVMKRVPNCRALSKPFSATELSSAVAVALQ